MFAPISLYLIASVLAIEENHQPNPSGNNDIAFALQQAAKAQKEAKKWLDQNKGDFMRGMDKNAMSQCSRSQDPQGQHSESRASGRHAFPNRGSLSRGSCPSRLFAKQGDKAGKGNNEDKGGGCFSKGTPPKGVSPEGASLEDVSSPNPSFSGGHETLAPMKTKNLLIFVSFSMPEASLKSLFQEAQKQGAVLVMRGLYQDSFVQTAQKFQQLGIAVDIHPKLFEAHHITSVPTFIKTNNGRPLYSLKGNVTLDFALKKFDQRVREQPVRNQLVGNQHVSIQRTKEAT